MDSAERRAANEGCTPARMTHYVEDMLNSLKRSHRVREEQLSSAVNTHRQRLENVIGQHERLLVAYRHASASASAHRYTTTVGAIGGPGVCTSPLFENMGLVIGPNLHRNSESGVGFGGVENVIEDRLRRDWTVYRQDSG